MNNRKKDRNRFLPKIVTRGQAKDTGMAMVLICLLAYHFSDIEKLIAVSIILLVVNMVVPQLYKPLAKLWLGLSNILGTVMSSLLLTILFFLLVTPIALFRRITGYDTLQLKKWKKDGTSVFHVRDHGYQQTDIEKPY